MIPRGEFDEDKLKQGLAWTWEDDIYSNEDSLVPVPLTEEGLSNVTVLLVRAVFNTKSGLVFNGLIVYSVGREDVYSIEIMSGRTSFNFNKFLPDLSLESLKEMATYLNVDFQSLLPVRYSIVPKELAIDDGEFGFCI